MNVSESQPQERNSISYRHTPQEIESGVKFLMYKVKVKFFQTFINENLQEKPNCLLTNRRERRQFPTCGDQRSHFSAIKAAIFQRRHHLLLIIAYKITYKQPFLSFFSLSNWPRSDFFLLHSKSEDLKLFVLCFHDAVFHDERFGLKMRLLSGWWRESKVCYGFAQLNAHFISN